MLLVENPEIIFNFWYVHDDMGVIYSLRARAYVGVGTDEEKLSMLKKTSEIDYVIAHPYPIPERFHLEIVEGSERQKMPVFHVNMLNTLDNPIALFEDAIKDIEDNLPAQTDLKISETPLTCLTPLLGNDEGEIVPVFDKSHRFEDL